MTARTFLIGLLSVAIALTAFLANGALRSDSGTPPQVASSQQQGVSGPVASDQNEGDVAPFNVRDEAYEIMKEAIPSSKRAWVNQSLKKLRKKVKEHRVMTHKVLDPLYGGKFSKAAVTALHLDFRFITQRFTDQIMAIALHTRQFRRTHGDEVAFAARFLVFLNLLDELGLEPGDGEYLGSPRNSHALFFDDVLNQLGVPIEGRNAVSPSQPILQILEMLASRESELIVLIVYLIVTEEEVMLFSPAMRAAVAHVGVDTDSGYYMVHGHSDDTDTTASDDLHQKDAWAVLGLLLTKDNYSEVEGIATKFLDFWNNFWDVQLARLDDDAATVR